MMDIADDIKDKYTMQVDLEVYGGDEWTPDLLKLYWQNIGTLTCKLCEQGKCTDGFGIPLSSGIYHFECSKLTPTKTGLESIEVKGCDGYDDYTCSDETKFTICKSRKAFDDWVGANSVMQKKIIQESECCKTNKFEISYGTNNLPSNMAKIDGHTAHDDGGEQLGQCEGFDMDDSKFTIGGMQNVIYYFAVYLIWEIQHFYFLSVEDSTGWQCCINHFRLYGGSSKSVDEEIAFGSCSFPDVHFDGDTVYRNETWVDWKKSPFECNLGEKNSTKIQTIHAKVCNLEESGTRKKLKAVFQVGKGEKMKTCEQNLEGDYSRGNYRTTAVTDNCQNLDIGSEELKLWILNVAERDAVCLENIYVDVSSRGIYN